MPFPRIGRAPHLVRPGGLKGEVYDLRKDSADAFDLLEYGKTASFSAPLDANTGVASFIASRGPILMMGPTADRDIDPTDAPYACVVKVAKTNATKYGLRLPAKPGWTYPSGLNQDYWLPDSCDTYQGLSWDLYVDPVAKYVRCYTPRWGFEPMMAAPTVGAGATLDLGAAGRITVTRTLTGAGGKATYQTGAPRSDGTAFITTAVDNTVRIASFGNGKEYILSESQRIALLLQNASMYSAGGVANSPWSAVGGATAAGAQAGSPMGDATATLVHHGALADSGIKGNCAWARGIGPETISVWAKVPSGTGTCRVIAYNVQDNLAISSGDVQLTTTWKQIVIEAPYLGAGSNAGGNITLEVQLYNGSDGVARDVLWWGPDVQEQSGSVSGNGLNSTIVTAAAQVTRASEGVGMTPAQVASYWPASFRTRGFKFSMRFMSSSDVLFGQVGTLYTIFHMVDDQGRVTIIRLTTGSGPTASRMWRIQVISGALASVTTGLLVRSVSSGFTWSAGDEVTVELQAYRGAIRIISPNEGDKTVMLGASWDIGNVVAVGIGSLSSGIGTQTNSNNPVMYGRVLTEC